MITEPNQHDIDKAFRNTNFGLIGAMELGRKFLVADCILKRACGFRDGGTIEAICKELKLLTKTGTPRKKAKQWAYVFMADLRKNLYER